MKWLTKPHGPNGTKQVDEYVRYGKKDR